MFSIGLLLGYLRYRSNSIWLTIILHGLNNLAAVVQTIWLAGELTRWLTPRRRIAKQSG